MRLHSSLLTQLIFLSFVSLSFSQTENDIRLYQPTANITRYQQVIFSLFSDPQTYQLGVLQIYLNGGWGSVCDDRWTSLDSQVVCSQLNLSYPISYSTLPILRTLNLQSPSNSPIWLDEVRCTGDERLLIDCLSLPSGAHDCTHREDVNLMCSDVNLVGVYQGIAAVIIILVVTIVFVCVCCSCCCCSCCPIARYFRPMSESNQDEEALVRAKESHILEFQPLHTQQIYKGYRQEIVTVEDISN